MEIYATFGLATQDIEEAKGWLQDILELSAQGGDNDYHGDYYSFGEFGGEYVKLCSGVSEDEDGKYPTDHDFPDESLLMYLSGAKEGSAILKAIESRPDRFEKLRQDRFDD
ncbi:MAG: hypothetical protein K0U74_02570 [Alphaproteobacteria bacterium]|nr:hypothetical protein [Alphaproteobacteria bacterium]